MVLVKIRDSCHESYFKKTPVIQNKSYSSIRKIKEKFIELILKATALVTILTTIGIIWVLLSESIEFFKVVSLKDFLTDKSGLLCLLENIMELCL